MLRTRVISAAIGLPIVLGAIFIGGNVLVGLVFLLTIQSLYEFYNAFKNIDFRPSIWIGYVGTIIYYCLILLDFESFGILISVLFIMIVLLFFEILKKDKDIIDSSITLLGIFYITFLYSNIIFLYHSANGRFLVWLPFIAGWSSDTFAYFIGNAFGKKKLSRRFSPNKTIEGSIGGILGSILFCLGFGVLFSHYNFSISLLHYVFIGFISSVSGQIGDLFASAIKRFCRIKDYSSILPGHGGILDRFDSILFIVPTLYLYFKIAELYCNF